MQAIRMLVDAEGAPHGHTVYAYEAGEIYRVGDTQPPMSDALANAFVLSGRATEVDDNGNPVNPPASRRARKSADAPAETTPAPSSDAAEASQLAGPAAEPAPQVTQE